MLVFQCIGGEQAGGAHRVLAIGLAIALTLGISGGLAVFSVAGPS